MRSSTASIGLDPDRISGDHAVAVDGQAAGRPLLGMPLLTALAAISTVLAVLAVDRLDGSAPPSRPDDVSAAPARAGIETRPTDAAGRETAAISGPTPSPDNPSTIMERPRLDAVIDATPGTLLVPVELAVRNVFPDLRAAGAPSVAVSMSATARLRQADPLPTSPRREPSSVPIVEVEGLPDVPLAGETLPGAAPVEPSGRQLPRGTAAEPARQERTGRSVRNRPIREPETTGSARRRAKARKPATAPTSEPAPSPTPFSLPGVLRPGGS